MNDTRKTKVLVVDDSALMRQLLTALLHQDPAIQVVGAAADPFIAREKIKHLRPDVITLDVEMPGMDGITFLEKLMRLHPMPVVMVSSLTQRGAETTLRALELGAIDFVTKPRDDLRNNLHTIAQELCDKIHMAAHAHVRMHAENLPQLAEPAPQSGAAERMVAIGASAGGTQAIGEILAVLPHDSPGIAVVQHMPPKFTTLFAAHLNDHSQLEVREARDGDRLKRGTVLIAPGGHQMAMTRADGGFVARVYRGEPVNLHQPAVDVLFDSVAKCAGAEALGILLTGMGADGAKGLLAMRQAGADTIAQDEATSVIFGMPDQAIKLGAAREVIALDRIARRILHWATDTAAAATVR
jgi:two-component system chemotaxis response regulator CheB